MPDTVTVRLLLESNWVCEMLAEVNSLLELDPADLPSELRQQALDFGETPLHMFSLDSKREATGRTDECWVRLKPTDAFLNFLLALRARNRELDIAV